MQTFIFLMVVIIAVCAILVLVILSQNPKGGGLSSTFGGSGGGQMFGVQRTNEFLDKATWTLAGLIVALVIAANVMMENPYAPKTSVESIIPEAAATAPTPDAPATPPAQSETGN
ncbi:preprotein translocase subunit SecG [Moheibacter stercoris]|uniref:Protein-export membrane protein SecG n=1 Tax=Moheibacter stercoris TaxID=1628251 RepID=A0ABV2LR16_9FLAO